MLVCGAGPVGLTAAAMLAHFNIPVRIIDPLRAPAHLSKALVAWRRTLQTLDPVLPYQQWIKEGARPVGGLDLADEGAVFASLDLAHAHAQQQLPPQQHVLPAGLIVTQSQIEAGLTRLLQDKYGIPVQRGTKLHSFSVVDEDEAAGGGGHVRCVLVPAEQQPGPHDPLVTLAAAAKDDTTTNSSPAASAANNQHHQQQQQDKTNGGPEEQEVVLASYLIGCDGARSTVRKGLGVPFKGFSDATNRFLMMDATYEHAPGINSSSAASASTTALPARDRAFASTTAEGLLLFIPLVDTPNAMRLGWNAGEATGGLLGVLNSATSGGQVSCISQLVWQRLASPAGAPQLVSWLEICPTRDMLQIDAACCHTMSSPGADGPAKPTLDDFQSLLMQHTLLQVKLKDVLWQSEFTVNERQVRRRSL